jgi:hypothetical protein
MVMTELRGVCVTPDQGRGQDEDNARYRAIGRGWLWTFLRLCVVFLHPGAASSRPLRGISKSVITVVGNITYYACLFLSDDDDLAVDTLRCRRPIRLHAYRVRHALLSCIQSQNFKYSYVKAQPWQCRV